MNGPRGKKRPPEVICHSGDRKKGGAGRDNTTSQIMKKQAAAYLEFQRFCRSPFVFFLRFYFPQTISTLGKFCLEILNDFCKVIQSITDGGGGGKVNAGVFHNVKNIL